MVMMTTLVAEPRCHEAVGESGFTAQDLETLDLVRAEGLARRRWSRAEIVRDRCLDYLAAWGIEADGSASPSLAIIRFKKSGTYALTVGSTVVATARSLTKILPAIQGLFGITEPLAYGI